jgi:leucyl aminopeptidase
MRVRAESIPPARVDADVLAVPIYADEPLTGDLAALDAAADGAVADALRFGDFTAASFKSTLLSAPALPAGRLLLIGMSERGGGARDAARIVASAVRRLQGRDARRLAVWLRDGEDATALEAAAAGAVFGAYRPAELYGRAKDTPESKRDVEEVLLVADADPERLERGRLIGEGVELGRTLANRAANDLTPERMADVARELEADGCRVEVLAPAEMRELGMEALLGVGQGSDNEPRLIAVRLPGWESAPEGKRLALVGKGVCFDSGGISIKPAERMEEMKWDKSGAAAVIAAARTVARLAPDTPLMAVAPMVENMPGSRAQRPGDVVRALAGKTVEVTNTDAEGRLILIDALAWAERQGASHLVDIATLTGAAAVALGEQVSAYFADPREWGREVQAAADAAGELFWEMPLVDEYRASLDTPFADIVNSGTRDGSLVKSALFIREFVTRPWVHVDIGGSAYLRNETPYAPKGCVGAGVATLTRLALAFGGGTGRT